MKYSPEEARRIIAARLATAPDDVRDAVGRAIVENTPQGARKAPVMRLRDYVREAWSIYKPGEPYMHNWHIDIICDHLEAVARYEIRKLIINTTPRSGKSSLTNVFFPSWVWSMHPERNFIYSSCKETLVTRDSVACRDIILSQWYKDRWGHICKISKDQGEKFRYQNTMKGTRICTTVKRGGTGEGANYIVFDDPHDKQTVDSDAIRKEQIDHLGTLITRVDPNWHAYVVTMQRFRDNDLSGKLINEGGWEVLCIPCEYEPQVYSTSLGWQDPRTQPNEILWPARMPADYIATQKTVLGDFGWAGEFQQRPYPAGGGLFSKWDFNFWCFPGQEFTLPPVEIQGPDGEIIKKYPEPLPEDFDDEIQSWDLAVKDRETSDYSAGQHWAFAGPKRYLLARVKARLSYPEQKEAVKQMRVDFPSASASVIEDKANGPNVILELQEDIDGVIPFPCKGQKLDPKPVRHNRLSPSVKSGHCYVPHPDLEDWVWEFINEHCAVPKSKNDDEVDAHAQAYLHHKGVGEVELWGGNPVSDVPEVINSNDPGLLWNSTDRWPT